MNHLLEAQRLVNRAWRRRIEARCWDDVRDAQEALRDHEAHMMFTGQWPDTAAWPAEQLNLEVNGGMER